MKFIILIFLTLFLHQVRSQDIPPKLKKIVNRIAEYNELDSEHVGYSGRTTSQYRNFIKLRSIATIDELVNLLNHKNAVVKGYASWALADRNYDKPVLVLEKFIESGEKVRSQHGCMVSSSLLAQEFYFRVYNQKHNKQLNENGIIIIEKHVEALDSVILHSEKEGYLLSKSLSNNNGNPKTYEIVRYLAFEKNNPYAIEAIGVYQRKQDISEIKRLGDLSFAAIEKFASQEFWDFLLTFKEKDNSLDYYLAIASYQNNTSAQVLEDMYKTMEETLPLLSEAITKYYCSSYQDLMFDIWKQHKMINIKATNQLIQDNPKKAALLFSKGLLDNEPFHFLEYGDDFGNEDKILPLMLKNITKYQRNKLNKICKQNIPTADYKNLGSFLDCVQENELKDTGPQILKRLETEKHPFDIHHLCQTMLTFKNSKFTEELKVILKKNRKDWDSEHWSKHFYKLFSEYDFTLE